MLNIPGYIKTWMYDYHTQGYNYLSMPKSRIAVEDIPYNSGNMDIREQSHLHPVQSIREVFCKLKQQPRFFFDNFTQCYVTLPCREDHMLNRSQRNSVHVRTVTLSWRGPNFVVIGSVHFKPEHCKFWSNFEFNRNIVSVTGACVPYVEEVTETGKNFSNKFKPTSRFHIIPRHSDYNLFATQIARHIGPMLAQRGADRIHVGPTWSQRNLMLG